MDCKFTNELGTITVSEDVVLKVAGCAALECYGIVGMAAKRTKDGIVQLLGLDNLGRGVIIHMDNDNSVDVDLYIVVEYGISISAVAETLIDTVKYKIEYLTGAHVKNVNVTVEDIRV
ncbi:MAG: Asp23/Gls24 family envelope stress response protein [Clostridia bacterium]|nr:Asp23/Gls24 family envelope stress response protein [Clostridia bacterium]MBQ9408581.1 Asp23/Gls24 family envelope stress response protein [Clostridia bacterium]MBR0462902.1 Asp23/Gls24 family envelope stress response protein [Clostridia bacterium]